MARFQTHQQQNNKPPALFGGLFFCHSSAVLLRAAPPMTEGVGDDLSGQVPFLLAFSVLLAYSPASFLPPESKATRHVVKVLYIYYCITVIIIIVSE